MLKLAIIFTLFSLNVFAQYPVISEITKNITCYGGSDGEINPRVSGGTKPYKYEWIYNDGSFKVVSNDSILKNAIAFTYKLKIVDSKGRTTQKVISLSQPKTQLIADISSIDPNCAYGSGKVNLTKVEGGTKPYFFLWNNGNTTQNLSNVKSGEYSVVVTDANSCVVIKKATVNNPSKVTLSTTYNNAVCYNTKVKLNNTAKNGKEPYIFEVYDKNNVALKDGTSVYPGFYRVRVIDSNGCTDETVGFFEVKNLYKPLVMTYVVNKSSTDKSKNGSIYTTVSGGLEPYTFKWSTDDKTSYIKNVKADDYEIEVYDKNKCYLKQKIKVEYNKKAGKRYLESDSISKLNDSLYTNSDIYLEQSYPNPYKKSDFTPLIVEYGVPLNSISYLYVYLNGELKDIYELNNTTNYQILNTTNMYTGTFMYRLMVDGEFKLERKLIIIN